MQGQKIAYNGVIFYEVDKLDSYVNTYDVLPTLYTLLVSRKFKDTFNSLENKEVQYMQAELGIMQKA